MRNNAAILFSVLALSACLPWFTGEACTGIYVGKRVSADGTVLIGRTDDVRPLGIWHRFEVVPARHSPTNLLCVGSRGFVRTWPSNTYAYVCTPRATCFRRGRIVAMGMNEKGLAMTATVTAWAKRELMERDPFVPTGLAEESITDYVSGCCATAREAVDAIVKIVADLGNSEGSIILLADKKEAWYVELYTGHHWAAMRLPEDRMAAFGNEFMLGEVEENGRDVLFSPGLVAFVKAAGCAQYGPSGRLHLAASLATPVVDFSDLRTRWGRRFFGATTPSSSFAPFGRQDLLFAPSKKVSVRDVFSFMRSRCEGTDSCPDTTGRGDLRVVGVECQATDHVLSVRDDVPDRFAVTAWVTLGPAEHSVFIPVSNAAQAFDPDWSFDSPVGASVSYRERRSAGVVLRRLCTLSRLDRKYLGDGVRDYWRRTEDGFLSEWPKVFAAAMSVGGDVAARLLTDYTCAAQRRVIDQAAKMSEALLDELDDQTQTLRVDSEKTGYGTVDLPERKPLAF